MTVKANKNFYIVVVAILLTFFSVNKNNQLFERDQESSSSSNSSSNSTSSSPSSNLLKDYAFISFNLSNEFDYEAKLTLKCPDGVYFDPSTSRMGSVSSYGSNAKDISGKYEFTYANTDHEDDGFMGLSSKKVRKTYTGSFYLDGKFESYDIEINALGGTVNVYGR